MKDKKKNVTIFSSVFAFLIVLTVLIILLSINSNSILSLISIYILFIADITMMFFWIFSLNIRYKEFEYKGHKVLIYAGMKNHYIKVDGIVKDEYIAMFSWTPIEFSCLIDNDNVQVIISNANHIKIKINGELYK